MTSSRMRRHPNQATTLEDLEDMPGPSLGIAGNKVQVTDIWLLKLSDDFGPQAAVSSSSGFHWVDIKELQEVAQDKWLEFDQWYFETHNRHPLSELRPSVPPASESDSDEPAVDWSLPSSRSTLRTIREIYKLMAAGSLEYYEHFNAAAASTRAAVGLFIFQMKTFRRWRETYLFQVNSHPIKKIISYAQDKQLAASLDAWRRSTAAALSKSSQYKQLSWFRLVRWFVCWRVNFRAGRKSRTARSKSMTFILKHSFNYWYQSSLRYSSRSAENAIIWQKLRILKSKTYLLTWRIQSRAFTSRVRKPLRSALKYWSLSSALSSKLKLSARWKLREFFNRLCLKERLIVSHRFKQIHFATWRHVSALYATELVLTSLAFNHSHRSLLVQTWFKWLTTKEQDLFSSRDTSRATNQWKGLYFERWKYDHVRNKASQGAVDVAEGSLQDICFF